MKAESMEFGAIDIHLMVYRGNEYLMVVKVFYPVL